ncbi:hypothetical protein [Paracoccus aminophilus]|uniref:DUF2946 domain-containing protein n=1 Tax=Paracoccus aminophilus JCM 7686 TaxID=1367847 RepID=S5Z101_PARAH|nr:hypothetical protein [Paracoccus aminophilus]AGT11101.1 hypothetical protein JCM7686_pAMI5p035 [Paracoccus aminophilus JCM 7686]
MVRYLAPLIGFLMLSLLAVLPLSAQALPVGAAAPDCCAQGAEVHHAGAKTKAPHESNGAAHHVLCELICAGGFTVASPAPVLRRELSLRSQDHPRDPPALEGRALAPPSPPPIGSFI